MNILFIILIILASVLLSLFVLIQNPKGGGLSSGFSGGANLIGVQRAGDILEKGTWILIIALMVFSIGINIIGKSSTTSGGLGDQIEAPAQTPSLNLNPTAKPTTETAKPAATTTPAATDSAK